MTTKSYQPIFCIPLYLVQSMSDMGQSHWINDDDTEENDDLRLTVELSGGHQFLLQGDQRLFIEDDELVIEELVAKPSSDSHEARMKKMHAALDQLTPDERQKVLDQLS